MTLPRQRNNSRLCVCVSPPLSRAGVVATMPFSKGDVVCDYHGKLVSESEGKKRMDATRPGAACYLFFFRGRLGTKLCVDSQDFPCECHPGKDTFGRRLNHSGKAPNVKPVVFRLNFADGPKDTVLFLAQRNIAVDQELRWDYGVRRTSFRGEGMDLAWLDH